MADKKTKTSKFDLEALIAGLPPGAATTAPSLPVSVLLQEGKALLPAFAKSRKKFVELPSFDEALTGRLPFLLGAFEDAEDHWLDGRAETKTKAKKGKLRVEGDALKAKMMKSLGFLFRKDEEKTAQLADIAEGDGLADLIQDLERLGKLGAPVSAQLQKFPDMPKGAAARATELSTLLSTHQDTDDAQALQARRNQIGVLFEADLAEVREAAHQLFDGDPKKLAPFISHHNALQAQKSRAKKAKAASGNQPAKPEDKTGENKPK